MRWFYPYRIVSNQLNINTENSALEIFTVDECSFDFLLSSFDEPFLPLRLTVFGMEIVERVEWVLPLYIVNNQLTMTGMKLNIARQTPPHWMIKEI